MVNSSRSALTIDSETSVRIASAHQDYSLPLHWRLKKHARIPPFNNFNIGVYSVSEILVVGHLFRGRR